MADKNLFCSIHIKQVNLIKLYFFTRNSFDSINSTLFRVAEIVKNNYFITVI